ncbi:MAG: class A beta-lactamase [Sphingopyxis sp.]|nr:class A beta-lactamase [Sphingopyxis sp.]
MKNGNGSVRRCLILFGACLLPAAPLTAQAVQPAARVVTPAALDQEIQRLAEGAGGIVGVAAWRLDGKGPSTLLNGDQAFPMASTFKVAVAGRILAQVDAGELTLLQMVEVTPDLIVPSAVIADRLIHPGISLSVHNLLELMMTQSDNSATDVLTKLAGGPAAVTRWVRDQGVEAQRIDRDTGRLLRDFYSLPEGSFVEAYATALKSQPEIAQRSSQPYPAFDKDPRDTSSPRAMADLLTRIFSGRALSPESTKVLTAIMERCRTGAERLPGQMPPGTVIAHKTGTIGGTVNDVGMITLPGDAGQIVIAVFVKESSRPTADRERAIAEIARTVRDHYLLTSGAD